MERARHNRFMLCVKNDGYQASLEVRKIYEEKRDPAAEKLGLVRVVDESNQDYLYPANFFIAIAVPKEAAKVFSLGPRPARTHVTRHSMHTLRANSSGRH